MPKKMVSETEEKKKTTKKTTKTVKTESKKENIDKVSESGQPKVAPKKAPAKKKKETSTTASPTKSKKTVASKTTAANKKDATKTTPTKKATAKSKTSTAKTKATAKPKKTTTKVAKVKPVFDEYYDLPYRYNQTLVKVLAQTPKTLFIYWDISDTDRKKLTKQFGEDFFNISKPILIVKNQTTGNSFEVEINDFANSWYLHVGDTKCKFNIELGRKIFKDTTHSAPISDNYTDNYVYITHSNVIETPNDRILVNKEQKMVYFMNIKENARSEKSISSLNFMKNMGKIYNIYSQMESENIENNPSSIQKIFKNGEE